MTQQTWNIWVNQQTVIVCLLSLMQKINQFILIYLYRFFIIPVHISIAFDRVSPEATDAIAQLQYFFAWPEGGYIPREARTYEFTYSFTQSFNSLAEAFSPPIKAIKKSDSAIEIAFFMVSTLIFHSYSSMYFYGYTIRLKQNCSFSCPAPQSFYSNPAAQVCPIIESPGCHRAWLKRARFINMRLDVPPACRRESCPFLIGIFFCLII